ncbi:MAG: hypothetical protein WAN36_03305, partial [Calditrichia bacterium]
MGKKLLKIFMIAAAVLLGIALIVVILYRFTGVIDEGILRLSNSLSGDKVQISYRSLEGNLFSGATINGLAVDFPNGQLKAEKARAKYSASDFLKGRYFFSELHLDSVTFIYKVDTTAQTPSQETDWSEGIDLSGLPRFRIDDLRISRGTFVLQKPQESQNFRHLELHASFTLLPERVDIQVKSLNGDWLQQNLHLRQASFKVDGSTRRVTLNQFNADVNGNHIGLHGEAEFQPAVRFLLFTDTSRIDLNLINDIIPEFPFENGIVTLYGSFRGNPADFQGELWLSGSADQYRISRASLN